MKKNNLWKLAGALALTAVLAGCSSSISQEEATTIALEHAGVAKEEAVSLSVQQEHEDGRDIFEVKFSTQDTEYSYDVAQKDGEIINYNYDSTGTPPAGASEGSSASGTEAQAVQGGRQGPAGPERRREPGPGRGGCHRPSNGGEHRPGARRGDRVLHAPGRAGHGRRPGSV